MDAFRAQKAFEKAEIANRLAEEEKKQKHEAALKKLHLDRQKQFADIDIRLKQRTATERASHVKTIQRLRQLEDEERVHLANRRNAFLQYKQDLNKQMTKNSEVRSNSQHAVIIDAKKNSLMID